MTIGSIVNFSQGIIGLITIGQFKMIFFLEELYLLQLMNALLHSYWSSEKVHQMKRKSYGFWKGVKIVHE